MRIFIVKDQKSVAALKGSLIRSEATAASVRLAKEELKAANPQADLNKLRPGAVLVVPEGEAFNPGESERVTGDVPDEIHEQLRLQLGALGTRLKRNWAEAEEAHKLQARELTVLVEEAKAIDKSLVKPLNEALAQLEEDARAEREARKPTESALRKAAAEMQALFEGLNPKD